MLQLILIFDDRFLLETFKKLLSVTALVTPWNPIYLGFMKINQTLLAFCLERIYYFWLKIMQWIR